MTAPGSVTPPAPGWWVKRNRVMFPASALLTLTGGTPVVSGPGMFRPTGASLVLTGSTPTIIANPNPFQSIGAGGSDLSVINTNTISTSWSHTASGNNRYVLAGIAVSYSSGPNQDLSLIGATCTYGGVSMTLLGEEEMGNVDPGPNLTGFVKLFGLANPATGAQTVMATVGPEAGTYDWSINGNSASYQNVTSVGAVTINQGNNTSGTHTVTTVAGRRACVFFGGRDTWASFNQTQRDLDNPGATFPNIILGDAPGAATVNFTATQGSSTKWATVGVELL